MHDLMYKIKDLLADIFEEECEEKSSQAYPAGVPERPRRRPWHLLSFLELLLGIMLILAALAYTTTHWTQEHVVNTRELHKHMAIAAIFLSLALFTLFQCFPRIMRTLFLGGALGLLALPLFSDCTTHAALWDAYVETVESLPSRLEEESLDLRGETRAMHFIADGVEWGMAMRIWQDVEHRALQDYLQALGLSATGTGDFSFFACATLFRDVYDSWTYRSDPKNRELYRPPHQTVKSFSGDCDDYSSLVAALFLSLGYEVRIILTVNHVYPELVLPDELSMNEVRGILGLCFAEYRKADFPPLYFHRDSLGRRWLNLDYTAPYPGGPFMSEEIFRVIDLCYL